jgi:Ca-activated chloride channel family protein
MIESAFPWALLALPVPLLVWWMLPRAPREGGAALRVPFLSTLRRLPASQSAKPARSFAVVAAKTAIWLLLIAAAAQPRWVGEPQPVASNGRDLMLALDLSASMAAPDYSVHGRRVDRHTIVNAVAKDFVGRREGDRVGLILFGSRAYLQAPLTLDRDSIVEMLDQSEVGLAGRETAIGDAIGLAVKHLRDRPAEHRVLVLLSDGESNAGVLDPVAAADLATQTGVRVYTIGIGAEERTIQTPFGPRVIGGGSGLDEQTLAEVATRTGGQYFRARDTESLVTVYRQIDALEPSEGEAAFVRPMRALFHLPLAAAFAVGTLLAACRIGREHLDLLARVAARIHPEGGA